jgi:membrane-bound lytic murein transglycosylase D
MAFLPPAHAAGATAASEVTEPPVVQSNLYLHNVPALISQNPVPAWKTRADNLLARAEQRYTRGRRLYQAQDFDNARLEFDAAVDLILTASEQNPSDRAIYERRLDQMADSIHRYDLSGLGAAARSEDAQFEKAPLEDILQMTFPVDPRLKDKVREQVAATVSQLPLSVNDAVLGYIHYFSNRGRKTMISGLQRAGKFRPLIRRILDEEGVPQELIHLAQAESGFLPRAMSRAKAGGMWQFLTWRGQQYGLMQTRWTDDRMDPEKATRAAARHLRDLYVQFGDWYLAIAAYNCGPGTIEKAVERTGYADFWELRNRAVIPRETTNYVPIILAMVIMQKNAAEYGIDNISLETPLEYDTIDISAPTSLALIADVTEAPVSELASLNPSVLRSLVPAGHALHVPKGTAATVQAALETVPAERRAAWRVHRVASGDTLAVIGKRYGAAPVSIASANRLPGGELSEGDRLLIPAAARPDPEPRQAASRTASKRRATASSTRRTSSSAAPVRKASARGKSSKSAPTAARKRPTAVAQTASR